MARQTLRQPLASRPPAREAAPTDSSEGRPWQRLPDAPEEPAAAAGMRSEASPASFLRAPLESPRQPPEPSGLLSRVFAPPPRRRKENRTGIPDNLKSGLESLSGIDLSSVRVHYDSREPQRWGALSHARGDEVHLGPGRRSTLPHELWHVVQQRQGRVAPTLRVNGAWVNDEEGLEKEAEDKAAEALQVAGRLRGLIPVREPSTRRGTSSAPPVLQRDVKKNEQGKFSSSEDPDGTLFDDEEKARSLDAVLMEYQNLLEEVGNPLRHIAPSALARLQRLRSGEFSSWVPEYCRSIPEVKRRHDNLIKAMRSRDYSDLVDLPPWELSESQVDRCIRILINEGFWKDANDLQSNLSSRLTEGQRLGYLYQLQQHVREIQRYRLRRIEPQFGKQKPSTRNRPRADAELVEGHTQPTQESFLPAKQEKRTRVLVDYKLGYRKEEHQKELVEKKIPQYAGTAEDRGETYGGIENTQSSPPQFRLQFRGGPPPGFQEKLQKQLAQDRRKNRRAFPKGLFLNSQQVLGPSEEQPATGSTSGEKKGRRNLKRPLEGQAEPPAKKTKPAPEDMKAEIPDDVRAEIFIEVFLEIWGEKLQGPQFQFTRWKDWKGTLAEWMAELENNNQWVKWRDLEPRLPFDRNGVLKQSGQSVTKKSDSDNREAEAFLNGFLDAYDESEGGKGTSLFFEFWIDWEGSLDAWKKHLIDQAKGRVTREDLESRRGSGPREEVRQYPSFDVPDWDPRAPSWLPDRIIATGVADGQIIRINGILHRVREHKGKSVEPTNENILGKAMYAYPLPRGG